MTEQNDNHSQRTIVLPPTSDLPQGSWQKPRILVTAGPLQGREFVMTRSVFSIGSGINNDLSIADTTVSKHHCELVIDDKGLKVIDLGSTNGTSIEGVRVTSARLAPNTEIQLGKTRIIVPVVAEKQDMPVSTREQFGACIGRSPVMRHVFYLAENAAPTDATVLITGEMGSGKEELAEELHNFSLRKDKPFIVIDCASLTPDRAERELFGAVDADTGDVQTGAFDLADGGTLFLDEIDALPLDVQPLLLRVMDKMETRRIGESEPHKINVRLIFATQKNLAQEVQQGKFREDLFYRISVARIDIPPLRRRKEDIPLLLKSIIMRLHGSDELRQWAEQDGTISVLKRYDWPGNVRELRNLVERIHYSGHYPLDLTAFLQSHKNSEVSEPEMIFTADRPFKDAKNELIEEFERKYLSDLLTRNAQNISKSARIAGIERAYLQRLIRKYGMRNTNGGE